MSNFYSCFSLAFTLFPIISTNKASLPVRTMGVGIPTRTILRYSTAADAWKALVEVYNSRFQALEASKSVTIEPLGI